MKTNILRITYTTLALLLPLAAAAQDLDPTVEVSRTYEGKLMEVHKPQLKMAVPDSVLRFDLDFDYSVMDAPYKGAYEFSPYLMNMKPSPTVYGHERFRLKVGAGYQLHPVFDLLWNPKFRTNAFRMNVYASHNSFIGRYWRLDMPVRVEEGMAVERLPKDFKNDVRTWKGFEAVNRLGVNGRADWEKGLFMFDVGYRGLMEDAGLADWTERYYDALDVRLGLASKKNTGLMYKVSADYLISRDILSVLYYTQDAGSGLNLKASEYDIDASLGYVMRNSGTVSLDLGLDGARTSGAYDYGGYDLDIVPHHVFERGKWSLDLGVRVSIASSSDRFTDVVRITNQIVYPDVRIEYQAVRDALKLYADVGGDAKANSYSDLLAFNRHANPNYCRTGWQLLDVAEERVNASVGAEARIGSHFSFDLRGGYVNNSSALMEGIYITQAVEMYGGPSFPSRLKPGSGYGSYDKAFAAMDWLLDTESVRFDGAVEYAHSWSRDSEGAEGLFLPAAFRGRTALTYDWRDRIFVGLDCEFSSVRKSVLAEIPGYADLGLNLKYGITRKLSAWARGGNLLGMTVQRNVLYAEKGPYFTAGICLNL